MGLRIRPGLRVLAPVEPEGPCHDKQRASSAPSMVWCPRAAVCKPRTQLGNATRVPAVEVEPGDNGEVLSICRMLITGQHLANYVDGFALRFVVGAHDQLAQQPHSYELHTHEHQQDGQQEQRTTADVLAQD